MASRPAASASGFITGMPAIVVQFGFATMPFGIERSASAFTSGTTSGTSGCMRHAEELSITVTPADATISAISRLAVAPAEKSAMSRPL